MNKRLLVYDRSRSTTDWTCGRMRYWQYEHDGKGIVSSYVARAPYTGQALHDGLAAIATIQKDYIAMGDINIDVIAQTVHKQMFDALMIAAAGEDEFESVQFAKEQATLTEGILRGFYRGVWPQLIAKYPTIIAIEPELRYDHDGLTFMSKPDLILADLEDNWFCIEYKSTSSKQENWVKQWDTAIQVQSQIKAIEETLKHKVTAVIIQGLYKGFISYGKQNSPFCYAYRRAAARPGAPDDISYEYRNGYRRTPTWEMAGGVKAWINGMPDDVLANQFPRTPPIFVKDEMVERFFSQRKWREKEIELAMQMIGDDENINQNILDLTFPQRFDSCHSYFGKNCQYMQICHGGLKDPLEMGFEYRTNHHKLEQDIWDEQDKTS